MDASDVAKLASSAWDSTVKAKRLQHIKLLKKSIPPEHHELFDTIIDIKRSGVQDDADSRILILLHGIQTEAKWQQELRKEFSDLPKLNTIPLGYGFVSAFLLWLPIRFWPTAKIVRKINSIRDREPNAKLMIIAHSFGTYITSKIIAKYPEIRFERIVFCGCIVRTDYRWDMHARYMQAGSILNDVGTKDIWPVVATASTIGYGSSGRLGFQTSEVRDRFFDYGHSDFFKPDLCHAKSYWKPFINDGTIIDSSWDTERPNSPFYILLFSNPVLGKIILLILVLIAIGLWEIF